MLMCEKCHPELEVFMTNSMHAQGLELRKVANFLSEPMGRGPSRTWFQHKNKVLTLSFAQKVICDTAVQSL